MGRLIDVDEAIKQLDPNIWQGEMLIAILKGLPTAYDVDSVVEHLTKRFDYCHEMAEKNDKVRLEEMAFAWREKASGVMDAIYIVKGAVKDD